MATFGLLQTLFLCFIITTVVSQQPIVSVEEIEVGGTFSVTCDAGRVSHIPASVNDITQLVIYRQTSQDTSWVTLAEYNSSGSENENFKKIPSDRKWTVEFTGANNGTNNRKTMKIVIQVSDAVCQDAGVYQCYVYYRSVTGGSSVVSRPQCVTSKSAVKDITLDADREFEVPGRPNYLEYQEGDNITLTCRTDGPEELEMKWMTGTHDTVSGFITSDYPYDNDITTFDPTLKTNGFCSQYAHMSVLNLRSLSQDVNDQVMYLCMVTYNDQPNATEVASANLTIGVTSSELHNGDKDVDDNIKAIIGGTIGGCIIIIIIVVVVVIKKCARR